MYRQTTDNKPPLIINFNFNIPNDYETPNMYNYDNHTIPKRHLTQVNVTTCDVIRAMRSTNDHQRINSLLNRYFFSDDTSIKEKTKRIVNMIHENEKKNIVTIICNFLKKKQIEIHEEMLTLTQ